MQIDLDKAELDQLAEVLNTMFRLKAIMLTEGKTDYQTECPRCGEILRARLSGLKNHLRISCDGKCGMSGLE